MIKVETELSVVDIWSALMSADPRFIFDYIDAHALADFIMRSVECEPDEGGLLIAALRKRGMCTGCGWSEHLIWAECTCPKRRVRKP